MRKKISKLTAALLTVFMAVLQITPAMAAETKTPPLTEGEHTKWIDRVQLPEYARKFYEICIEASDNDGYLDYFIQDRYFERSPDPVNVSFEYLKTLQIGDFFRTHKFTGIYVGEVNEQDKDYAFRSIGIAYQAFLHDYPEVFWLGGQWQTWFHDKEAHTMYLFFSLDNTARTSSFRYPGYSEASIQEAIAARDTNVAKILSEMPETTDASEKARYFHDYLINHNQYNTLVAQALEAGQPTDPIRSQIPTSWECISALSGLTGTQGPVCYAYAKAFKVLCDQADIPCVITCNQQHVWNYTKIGENWYGVDVMRDDPARGDGAVSGYEQDDYLLAGAYTTDRRGRRFLDTHPVENGVWLYPGDVPNLWLTNGPSLREEAYAPASH